MAHSRIEPYLIDSNPKSVIRVFDAIDKFLNFDKFTDPSHLKAILFGNDYDSQEKYLLLHYLIQYLNKKNSRSFISKKIKEIEDTEDFEDLINKRNQIEKYANEIISICDLHLVEYKRKATSNLKSISKTNFSGIGFHSHISKFKKLPLNFEKLSLDFEKLPRRQSISKKVKFKQSAKSIFKNIFSDAIADQIIENFFLYEFIDYNAQYLHITLENSAEVYEAFYHLYKLYRNEIKSMKEIAKENLRNIKIKIEAQKVCAERNDAVFRQLLEEKEQMYLGFQTTKKDYYNATKKSNFAMIMYLSFPKIRDNYMKLKSKRELSVDDYIKIVSRNIKSAT